MNFCKVIIAGNLTRDPEVRFTQSGTPIVSFAVAVNRRYAVNGERREETSFVDVTMWGARGETFAKFHHRGSPAFLEGYLKQETWDDKATGAKRSKLIVVAESFEFCGEKSEGSKKAGAQRSAPERGHVEEESPF